jgi:4-hydroxy-tetrahydrodipicolinate synthase
MARIRGVIGALPTPFEAAGNVDHDSLAYLVEALLKYGLHGVATLALHSEGYKLTEIEQDAVVHTVVQATAGRVPVIVGVVQEGTHPAIKRALRMTELGADAIMILPPSLVKPSSPALLEHFTSLAKAVPKPLIIQDSPQLTGFEIPLSLLETLYQHFPTASYIKVEGLPAGKKVSRIVKQMGPEYGVLCGWGGVEMLEALDRGACGCMPAAEFGPLLAKVYIHYQAGETEQAQALFNRLLPLINFASRSLDRFVILSKTILARKGLIKTPLLRHPYTPLDEFEQHVADKLLASVEIL